MVHYKLYYFNLRARGEIARQLLALAGEPFEDIRVDFAEWPSLKKSMPFEQLPVLEADGEQISQSHTIARYLAKKLGFSGGTILEQAHVDALADQYNDFFNIIRPFFLTLGGFMEGDWEALLIDVVRPARDDFFKIITKILLENDTKHNSGFLVGEAVTWVDLLLAEHVSTIKAYDPHYTRDWPRIQEHWAKVRGLKNLDKWISERPETIY